MQGPIQRVSKAKRPVGLVQVVERLPSKDKGLRSNQYQNKKTTGRERTRKSWKTWSLTEFLKGRRRLRQEERQGGVFQATKKWSALRSPSMTAAAWARGRVGTSEGRGSCQVSKSPGVPDTFLILKPKGSCFVKPPSPDKTVSCSPQLGLGEHGARQMRWRLWARPARALSSLSGGRGASPKQGQ
jgi:hypothetical protein